MNKECHILLGYRFKDGRQYNVADYYPDDMKIKDIIEVAKRIEVKE